MAVARDTTKEGNVMEGLFSMYVAAVLIDPKHGIHKNKVKQFINSLAVNTQLKELSTKGSRGVKYNKTFPNALGKSAVFGTTIVTGTQAKKMLPEFRQEQISKFIVDRQSYFESIGDQGYPDFSQVHLKIALKEAEVGTQYGSNLQKLIDGQPMPAKAVENFESIKKRMDTLIKARSSSFFNRLISAKKRYLDNDTSDVMHWQVDADGVGGEKSRGTVKQDVSIKVWANGKRIFEETLNFSLKASTVTVHSGGIYDGIQMMYELFGAYIPATEKTNSDKMINDLQNGSLGERLTPVAAVDSLWRLLLDKIPTSPNMQYSDHFWDVLEARLFGTGYKGYIQVLEMNQTEIREITQDYFNIMRTSGMLLYPKVVWSTSSGAGGSPGGVFIMPKYKGETLETNKDKAIYKIRVNYLSKKEGGVRTGPKEPFKFMTDLGGVNSVVHHENYEDFLDQGLV